MTVRTRAQLNGDADTYLPDNTAGEISPADVRQRVKDLADSALFDEDVGTAAEADASDFATAAQGAKADTAVQPARTISAGTGLTGGGSLAADRTLALSSGSIASLALADSAAQKSANLSDLASAATAFGNIKQNASTSATGVVELATVAEFRSDAAGALALSPAEVWDAAEWFALTDASTITINMASFLSLASAALGGNRSFGTPSNAKPGQHFIFKVTASSSTRTLTLPGAFVLASGVETGPYSITTSETLLVCGFVDSSSVLRVTAVLRF